MAKCFSHQMSKHFHICKWISFAISTFVIVKETPSEGIDQLHSMKTSKRRKKAYPNLQKGLLKNNGKLLHIETTGNCCWRFYKKKSYRGESEDVCPGFEGLPRFMPNSVKQIEKCENADC